MVFSTTGAEGFSGNMAFWGKSFKDIGNIFKSSWGKSWNDFYNSFDGFDKKLDVVGGKVKAVGGAIGNGLKDVFTKTADDPFELMANGEATAWIVEFAKATDGGAESLQKFNRKLEDPGMKAYLETVEAGKATVEGYTKFVNESNAALKATSLSSKAAAAGMEALAAAGNMVTDMIAAWAIQKLAEGIDYVIHEEEKLAEKSSTLRQEYKSLSDEIASTEEQLKTMGDRIKELEGLKAPSLADENELARLKESNTELERQKTLKEQLLNIAKLEAEKAAVQTISTISDNGKSPGYISNMSGEMKGNIPSNKIDFAKEQMTISDDYKAKIQDAQKQQLALGEITAETQAEYNKLQLSIDAYSEKQSDANKNVVESVSFLNEQRQGLILLSIKNTK